MNFMHKKLSSGDWFSLSLVSQMANIGSEVSRAMSWRKKRNTTLSTKALNRGLELIYLTVEDPKNKKRLKEITRVHELLVDDFLNGNVYKSKDELWEKYFLRFAVLQNVRKNK